MATAKAGGGRDPSGRDLVFEDWYRENIVAAGSGAALEQRSILRAYRRSVPKGVQLGPQGVERMLNTLGVKRSVRAGKPYRLGVGFREAVASRAASGPAGQPPPSASRPPPPAKPVEDGAYDTARADRSTDIAWEILAERTRQVEVEGFDADHDDASDPGAHERAAACYAYAAGQPEHATPFVDFAVKGAPREGRLGWIVRDTLALMWPWSVAWWKPKTEEPGWRRRCMVKGAALLLAAIERHDRDAARQALADSQAKDMTGV